MSFITYRAPKGRFVLIMTSVVGLATAGLLIAGIFNSGLLITSLLLLLILIFSFLFSPTKYSLDDQYLKIHRPIGYKMIRLEEIVQAKAIEKSDLSGTIRTFGVGGLFGLYGRFHNSKLGPMQFYVSQYKNLILITTQDNRKIVISPSSGELLQHLISGNTES